MPTKYKTPGTTPTVGSLASVTSNGDGTATIRQQNGGGQVTESVVDIADLEAEILIGNGRGPDPRPRGPKTGEVEVLGKTIGKGLQDCTLCRYGKPALMGAVGGLAIASVLGQEPTRGVVWGGVSGLLYGHLRG